MSTDAIKIVANMQRKIDAAHAATVDRIIWQVEQGSNALALKMLRELRQSLVEDAHER